MKVLTKRLRPKKSNQDKIKRQYYLNTDTCLASLNILLNSILVISDHGVSELAPIPMNLSPLTTIPICFQLVVGQVLYLLVLVLLLMLPIVTRGFVYRLARAQRHRRALHIRAASILRRNRRRYRLLRVGVRLRLRLRRLLRSVRVLRLEVVLLLPIWRRRRLIGLLRLLGIGLLRVGLGPGIWLLRLLRLLRLHLDFLSANLARCHCQSRTVERLGMKTGFAVTM